MNKQPVLRDLQRSLDLTLPFFELELSVLRRSYGQGKWNARQILCHLADTEVLFQSRLRLILSQPGCAVEVQDPDRWARTLVYADRKLPLVRKLYVACRESLMELVDLLPEAIFGRDGKHPKHESYRAWDVVTKAATHNYHHYGQLSAIHEDREWKAHEVNQTV